MRFVYLDVSAFSINPSHFYLHRSCYSNVASFERKASSRSCFLAQSRYLKSNNSLPACPFSMSMARQIHELEGRGKEGLVRDKGLVWTGNSPRFRFLTCSFQRLADPERAQNSVCVSYERRRAQSYMSTGLVLVDYCAQSLQALRFRPHC